MFKENKREVKTLELYFIKKKKDLSLEYSTAIEPQAKKNNKAKKKR